MSKALAPAHERPTVLLVDDQQANLLSFEVLLDDFDVNLLRATSGNEALQLMMHHDVALVLLDVQMPGMDGFEVAELMKKTRRTQKVPIIFVTAINRDLNHVLRGYETGAVDFLTKPVEPVVLRSKIRVFLELDRKTRELEASNRALQHSLKELERLKAHNEMLLWSIGEGILSLDTEGRVLFANPIAEALLDDGTTVAGSLLSEHFAVSDPEDIVVEIMARCMEGERWHRAVAVRRSGRDFPAELTATAILSEDDRFEGVSIVIKDITDRQKQEQKLKAESERDPLTGLVNRRAFERLLSRRLGEGGQDMALLYVDLDRFKPVNDRFGHQTGDALLRVVAQRMTGCTRQEDVVARIGGDEFCIVLKAENIQAVAGVVARKLVDVISQAVHLNEELIQVGASVGIVIPAAGVSAHALMHQADLAMYEAKARGRNTCCFYEASLE